MATAKTEIVAKLLIQIDDEVREMTDEEFARYQEMAANSPVITSE